MIPWTVSGSSSTLAALEQNARVLLGVQRVAAGAGEQRFLGLRVEQRLLEQRLDEARGVVVGERRERDRQRVRLAAAPARPPLQELGARGAEHEQRHAARALDELVDEVEQRVVGPVQILEHEHQRPPLGQRLEEAAPGGERLSALRSPRSSSAETDERPQMALEPLRLGRVDPRLADGAAELLLGLLGGSRLEDARLRLDDLGQRPERHAVAVGKRAALAPA